MTQDELIATAKAQAAAHGLPPELVCAVCEQESGDRNPDPVTGHENWDPWAIRYEPAFYQHYIQLMLVHGELHDETEARARAFSWGLMQVMGQTARENGYVGHLAGLCEPKTGTDVGCRVLSQKLAEARGNTKYGLLLWNGGSNPLYPEQVLARTAKYAE